MVVENDKEDEAMTEMLAQIKSAHENKIPKEKESLESAGVSKLG